MVNRLHLYSAFIQSAVKFMRLIHPFTHTLTHQRRLAAMQGTNQLVRSNWGLGVLVRDISTRPGWDRTGNPPTAGRLLLPPEPQLESTPPFVLTNLLWCKPGSSVFAVLAPFYTFTVFTAWVFSLCVCVRTDAEIVERINTWTFLSLQIHKTRLCWEHWATVYRPVM